MTHEFHSYKALNLCLIAWPAIENTGQSLQDLLQMREKMQIAYFAYVSICFSTILLLSSLLDVYILYHCYGCVIDDVIIP